MDRVSSEVRSKIMAAVRSSGNRSTELMMGRLLRQAGLLGYRKQWPVDGRPDFAWPGLRIALFVDGCFWHGCPRCKTIPNSNRQFWANKIAVNQRRDRRVTARLRRKGWTVIRVRECKVHWPGTMARIRSAVELARAARQMS